MIKIKSNGNGVFHATVTVNCAGAVVTEKEGSCHFPLLFFKPWTLSSGLCMKYFILYQYTPYFPFF